MPPSPDTVRPLAVRIARRIPYVYPAAKTSLDRFREWRLARARTVKNITRKNTLRAYNRVYRSDSLLEEYLAPARLAFYEEVAGICASIAARSVVDVGCGNGQLLRYLVDRMALAPETIVGIDHSGAGIDRARALIPEGRFLVADLYRLPDDVGRFDLVLCTEVLEHVQDSTRAVEVLCELCAPGGRVAITVPDGAQDTWEGHVNFWDEDAIGSFLAPFALLALDRIQNGTVFLAWLAPHEGRAGDHGH